MSGMRHIPTSYSTYRGYRIFWRTDTRNRQLVCYVLEFTGQWNSEQALRDYIDFRLGPR